MTKPVGSESNQLLSNDQLGRLAYLDDLPADVLKALQSLAWRFSDQVQVEDSGTLAGAPTLASKQYVQDVMNRAATIELLDDGFPVVLSVEQLACRTLIFTGAVSTQAPVTFSIPGQWFVSNRCTGSGSVLLQSCAPYPAVTLIPGETATIYVDADSVTMMASPLGSAETNGQGRLLNIQSFLKAGTYKYVPSPGTRMILVYGAGAGAASAGLPACALGYAAIAQAGTVGAKAFALYLDGFDGAIITVGAGGPSQPANDAGQAGLNGGTSSLGGLLTLPGGQGGTFALTNNPAGATAHLGQGANAPSGTGIITASSAIAAPAAFVSPGGMFGGIEPRGDGLLGSSNGLGGIGQASPSGSTAPSTPTNAGNDGGFVIYELT